MPAKAIASESIVTSLYEGTLDADVWRSALMSLAAAVGGSGLCLISWLPTSGRLLRDEIVGIDANAFDEYRRHWAAKDLRVPAGVGAAELEPITEEIILPRGAWERSDVFSDFLRHHDTSYLLAAWLQKGTPVHTSISIQAPYDHGPFDIAAVDWLRPLLTHVRRALTIREKLEQQQFQLDALRIAFDHAAYGVVLLDKSGRIIDASRTAFEVLLSVGALEIRSHGSYELVGGAARRIRELLASKLRSGVLTNGTIQLERPNGRPPACLTLAPLTGARDFLLTSAPRWLLLVADPERSLSTSVPLVMQHLGISEREAEIAVALASGARVGDVSRQFGITPHTVRSHLRSMFAKTGAHSQTELVRRVLSLPVAMRTNPTGPYRV